jgi:hypothetical protein
MLHTFDVSEGGSGDAYGPVNPRRRASCLARSSKRIALPPDQVVTLGPEYRTYTFSVLPAADDEERLRPVRAPTIGADEGTGRSGVR